MKRLLRWMERQARADDRRPRLDDALITNRAAGYALYRLRFLTIRMVLRAALHLLEVVIFAEVFSLMAQLMAMDGGTVITFGHLLLVRTGMTLVSGLYWGGLEALREQVREAVSLGKFGAAARAQEAWLSFTLLVSTGLVALGAGLPLLLLDEAALNPFLFGYYLVCLVRLAFDLLGRTYHSGVFAIRRIYRPLWSLLLPDLLDVLLIGLIWSLLTYLGFFAANRLPDVIAGFLISLSLSFLLVGLLRFALLVGYVRRTARTTLIPPVKLRRLFLSFRHLSRSSIGALGRHGAAHLSSQMDSALIVVLIVASRGQAEGFLLAQALYLLRPFLGAGYAWARLFYFDFKWIRGRYSAFVTARFDRFMRRVALWTGVLSAVLSVLWIGGVMPLLVEALMGIPRDAQNTEDLLWVTVLLTPFAVARARLGLFQVQAFANGHYRYLFGITVALAMGLGLSVLLVSSPLLLLLVLTALVLVLVFGFPVPASSRGVGAPDAAVLNLPLFLQRWARSPQDHVLGFLRVNRRIVPVSRVLDTLCERFPDLRFARVDRSGVLWSAANPVAPAALLAACGGAVFSPSVLCCTADRESALSALTEAKVLPPPPEGEGDVIARLRRQFTERFSGEPILDVEKGGISRTAGVRPMEIRRILRLLSSVGSGPAGPLVVGDRELAVFMPGGVPTMVFLMPLACPSADRREFRQQVHAATLWASVR